VLVVDDDQRVRDLVRSVLSDEGYRVQTAANGAAALDALRFGRPDAIVLDVQMPVMGGWAFRAAQLDRAETRSIPVVLATASGRSQPPSPELAPDAVLLKPFDLSQLLATLHELLARGAASASAAAPDASGAPHSATAAGTP
jgi:CheY-like chemotaxis protein